MLAFGSLDGWRLVPDRGDFPLGEPEGIAVDSQGRIYIGLQFYHRVQEYDKRGNFLVGWRIPTGARFRLRVNSKDELEVIAARREGLMRYSASGELLWRRSNVTDQMFADFGPEGEKRCETPDGIVIVIERSLLFPRIVELFPSGERRQILQMPWYKWVLMGPLPAWLWIPLGGVVFDLGKRLKNA